MPTSDKPRRRWNHWVVSLLGMFAAIGALTLLPQVERALAPVRSFGSYSTNKRPLSITLKTGEQASYRVAATYQASMTSPEPSMWHGLTFEISPLQAAPLRSQLSPSDVTALFDAFIAEVSANPSAFFADAHEIASMRPTFVAWAEKKGYVFRRPIDLLTAPSAWHTAAWRLCGTARSALIMAILGCALWTIFLVVPKLRRDPYACRGCKYDLRGLPMHTRCPECGRAQSA
jgi:hypothetical protein